MPIITSLLDIITTAVVAYYQKLIIKLLLRHYWRRHMPKYKTIYDNINI